MSCPVNFPTLDLEVPTPRYYTHRPWIIRQYASFSTAKKPSRKIISDIMGCAATNMPKYNLGSTSGYHMQEVGNNAVLELKFTISDGLEQVRGLQAGVSVDEIILSFHPKMKNPSCFILTAKSCWSLMEQDPFSNVIRTTVKAMLSPSLNLPTVN
ncbi:methylmalonyl-CoA mutase [Planoprotostelium fungivorum]|uniref:Methylmalonyl-CoA mutase n=1 Tax=Planoprotostelium fungivorum TaxID=1890364 RepID=A0A2P6MZA1_9EUKA|nr:methylmalonyl-CoA mutase [Planoprotostelium fungivorum]